MAKFFAGARGEYADRPSDVPTRGWWQVLRRVARELSEDQISVIAAAIGYYALLSIFPGIAMLIMVYGLVSDPATAQAQIENLAQVMPQQAYEVIAGQLERVTAAGRTDLGFGVLVSFVFAAWGASRAVQVLIVALNIAYEEQETRGIIKLNLIAIGFTIGGACFVTISIAAIAAAPAASAFGLGTTLTAALASVQWLVLAAAAIFALAVVYRYAPCRSAARVRWLTPGAILATFLWLLSSLLFSFYVANFGNYNETFGSIGAVVILLLWFYISAFAVCIGAELNAELERQTYRDSTSGPSQPIGMRGAYVADHTAEPSD